MIFGPPNPEEVQPTTGFSTWPFRPWWVETESNVTPSTIQFRVQQTIISSEIEAFDLSIAKEAKAMASRRRLGELARASLFGIQPRNNHHRSLRGYADAPRRPCYRGSR